ncbi:head-tail adaptor protein [Endozoicomonas sp. Mp262]|uniref:head-tail adaptor protein n=1 Tax=Endozoicomonas sp. Mp262 TaxID=2919499 RepID=UPI0021D84EBE
MQAGKLREYAYFVIPTKNEWGERSNDYEVAAAFRADISSKTDIDVAAGMEADKNTLLVMLRHRKIPNGAMLAWQDRFYLITGVVSDTKRRWLKLECLYKPQAHEYSIRKVLRTEKAAQTYHYVINRVLPEVLNGHGV